MLQDSDLDRVRNGLSGAPVCEQISGERVRGHGSVTGPLFCANLTTLNHLLGTPWHPQLSGNILVLEDVGEYPYRIDRMMCQFSQSGVLDELAAVCLGEFVDCGEEDAVMAAILPHLPSHCSILAGLPVGHGGRNVPIPCGALGELDGSTLRWRVA